MTGETLRQRRSALYAVKTLKKVIRNVETIATLQVDIGDVLTMIVIYSFQWDITKYQSSFITLRTMTVI